MPTLQSQLHKNERVSWYVGSTEETCHTTNLLTYWCVGSPMKTKNAKKKQHRVYPRQRALSHELSQLGGKYITYPTTQVHGSFPPSLSPEQRITRYPVLAGPHTPNQQQKNTGICIERVTAFTPQRKTTKTNRNKLKKYQAPKVGQCCCLPLPESRKHKRNTTTASHTCALPQPLAPAYNTKTTTTRTTEQLHENSRHKTGKVDRRGERSQAVPQSQAARDCKRDRAQTHQLKTSSVRLGGGSEGTPKRGNEKR